MSTSFVNKYCKSHLLFPLKWVAGMLGAYTCLKRRCVVNVVYWNEKLEALQDKLKLSTEQLAETLGMTPRTLYDFMKRENPRTPTEPVQRLIEYLLGERTSPGLREKPQLNLVIIHGDFRIANGPDGKSPNAVNTVIDMHAADGTYRDNEFHLVTDEPNEELKGYVRDGLSKRRVQPHFFVCDFGLNSQEAKDCYFTATAVWLATQAMRRDLKHITIAADPEKFWPLARELKDLAGVMVTFIRNTSAEADLKVDVALEKIGIKVARYHLFRKFGRIHSLLGTDLNGGFTHGFITPDEKSSSEVSNMFFSWNHMHRDENREFEKNINQLAIGDEVSFIVGMNNRGACATDVVLRTLVAQNDATTQTSQPTNLTPLRDKKLEEIELNEIFKKALSMCADKDGWALSSEIGNRVNQFSDFKARLQVIKPGLKISKFCAESPDIFEFKPHGTDPYGLIRLKQKRG